MSSIKQLFKKLAVIGCMLVLCYIPDLSVQAKVVDVDQVLNDLGSRIHESCTTEGSNGQCWLQSTLFSLGNPNPEWDRGLPTLNEHTLHYDLLEQFAISGEGLNEGVQAHQLNALLVQEYGVTIFTIEVNEQGLLHMVLVTPSHNDYEYQVLFYGGISDFLAAGSAIQQTIQQALWRSDIRLFLTPHHVQAVVRNLPDTALNRETLLLPVDVTPVVNTVFVSESKLYPSFRAFYGAVNKDDQLKESFKAQRGDYRADQVNKYKGHREKQKRWMFINSFFKVLASTLMAGAAYYYQEPIAQFIQPYWDERERYFETALIMVNDLKDASIAYLRLVPPILVSVKNEVDYLMRRYYWGLDTSVCTDRSVAIIQKDWDGSFRTKGLINDKMVNLLIDTGASSVSMSIEKARELGFSNFAQVGKLMKCHTASHLNVDCYQIVLPYVMVGCIKLFNVEAAVMESESDEILLGRSFLNRLSWRQNGGVLELQAD